MSLADMLHPACIEAGVAPKDKDDALRMIASLARKNPALTDVSEESILMGLKERESLGSTGFGEGIAIPHCRLKGIDEFTIGIMTVPDGVPFDAMDGKPVNLVVFVIAPESAANQYIRLLSNISQTLRIPGATQEIVTQKSSETVRESFLRHTRDTLETKEHENRRLFQCVVQDEVKFESILEVFEAVPDSSVIVIEAKNTREYLATMPLFASLWSDSHLGSSRVILATISASQTNETLRAIQRITGDLDRRTGVLVTVQDVLYSAGSLET